MAPHRNDTVESQMPSADDGVYVSQTHLEGAVKTDEFSSLRPECGMSLETEDNWKKNVRRIPERCDLSGLSTEPTQYQLSSTGLSSKRYDTVQHTSHLSRDLVVRIKQVCLEKDLDVEALVLFAVHQTLNGFGRGSDTTVASLLDLSESSPSGSSSSSTSSFSGPPTPPAGPVWSVAPSIKNHNSHDSQTVGSAMAQATSADSLSGPVPTRVVDVNELIASELVDLVVVFDNYAPVPAFQFPLVLRVSLYEPLWKLSITYYSDLFNYSIIDSLQSALRTFLTAPMHPDRLVKDIELLPTKQVNQLAQWNDTDGAYPSTKRLHHLVEEVAAVSGDRTAIEHNEESVSYQMLNRRANGLARYLCSLNIQPEQLVGLFLDKSDKMIIAILGVWKSGAAHVPIDPNYPNDRVRFVLDDARVQIMIASERHLQRLRNDVFAQDDSIQLLSLEKVLAKVAKDLKVSPDCGNNLSHLALTSKQLAYVTYTSGTTGFPKGIYKEHTSVVSSITDLVTRYGVAESDDEVILLFSAYVFEPFVRQMLMALTTGSKLLVISDEDKFDPGTLVPLIQSRKVTYLNGTASVLQEYDFASCPSLRRLILVGENLTPARYKALRQRFKGRILSEYGFTESAFVTALKIFEPESKRTDRSLGRPVRNVKCYILDANLKRVPIGVTGELYIGGLGITRGYMNRAALTRDKFLPNSFQTDVEKHQSTNKLMYKTGDLARWLPNGEVEYLGRADFQIKLRGIRIEPGEIEATLATYQGVRTSIVVSKKLLTRDGKTTQEHLVGYFVCDETPLAEHDLLTFLETKLPRYMIPSRLIQLPQIPVTINGKADLAALPEVHVVVIPTKELMARRRHDLDEELATIWAEILQISRADIVLDSNFFRLGGHSIACIQLIARARERLHRGITLEEVFKTKTLKIMSDLLAKKEQTRESGKSHKTNAAKSSNGVACHISGVLNPTTGRRQERRYLANSLQQGFVYHALKLKGSDAYIMQSTIHYRVAIDEDRYKKAWNKVYKEHPSLRLCFAWEGEVSQIISSLDSVMDWREKDWAGSGSHHSWHEMMEHLLRDDRHEGYTLNKGSLLRVYSIRLSGSQHLCCFSCHHAILDGWALPLLFDHVHQAYLDLAEDSPSWEDETYLLAQEYLQDHREDHLPYWQDQVQQIGERCDMNSLLNEASRYKVPLADYDKVLEQRQQTIPLPWTDLMARDHVKNQLDSQGITLHSILQLVWHLVLHSYGGGSHTITGTTISGRNLPIEDIESAVGLFINTLPLIIDQAVCHDLTVLEALDHVQGLVNAMNSRSNVELGRLGNNDFKHGLFDSLFVLENYPNLDTGRRRHQAELQYTVEGGLEKLSYPLAVIARQDGDGCSFTLCYAAELFSDETIRRLLQTVSNAFKNVMANMEAKVSSIEFLSANESTQLDKWNATECEYPNTTLHALFESEAQQKPHKTAVVYQDTRLSYSTLNSRANALAYYLLDQVSIKPNQLVALVMHKSEHLITSILAVWKTGGAYVPIDPEYPDERIQYILEDTAALAIITDAPNVTRMRTISKRRQPIVLSDLAVSLPPSAVDPSTPCIPTDLAYIMYTSGTTGKPKGVMVEHHGVVNLCASLSKTFGLRDTDDEVILSFSNYVFDHFVEQMTDALLNGQTLVVLNDDMRGDKERLYKYIGTNRVTYLSGTPSVLSMYEFERFRDHLRRIDCVGEAFSEPVFDKIRDTFPGLVINGYGPTEVSITTHKRPYPYPERRMDKSIGKQIANSKTYVLNDSMKRVPIGAMGELYLGGDGVARGYHNRPDLSTERFPLNPFQTEAEKRSGNRNSRLYKTGDLVRWVADGEIEYLGRNDFQVKIRGQRIELGEIEAVLSSYPEIIQSVVLAKDRESDGQKYLVGYFMPTEGHHLSTQSIHRFMLTRLPEYMVPAKLASIDTFPVTVSGKLDTKALTIPGDTIDDHVVSPRTDTEKTLARIWADLLEVPLASISIYSDFFGLGGDSLKSTKLSFAATRALDVSVSVRDLFANRTIEALAELIDKTFRSNSIDREASVTGDGPVGDGVPVSPAQERLIFLHEFDGNDTQQQEGAYNIAMHVCLENHVSLDALERAIRDVVSRHEALRTLITRSEMSHIQKVLPANEAQSRLSIHVAEGITTSEMERQMIKAAQMPFKIGSELPILVQFYHTRDPLPIGGSVRDCTTSRFATVVIHHLAFDGWSWNIFKKDLAYFYSIHTKHATTHKLPPLSAQYKEYAARHQHILLSQQRETLSDYWLQKLTDLESLYLAADHPRPPKFDYIGNDIQQQVLPRVVDKLRDVAKREGTSLYTVCLSAYILLLSVYTSQTDITTGIPVTHRTSADFESVIGFFVNLLPLRVSTDQNDVHQLVQAVRKELMDVQTYQDLPFQNITKLLDIQHDASRHPLVQTVFNWEISSSGTKQDTLPLLDREYVPSSPFPSAAKFDLNVTMREAEGSLSINLNYATGLFEQSTINGFLETFSYILEAFASCNTNASLSRLSPTVQPGTSATRKDAVKAEALVSLDSLFELQVVLKPNSIALADGTNSLSYREIDDRANQLAHLLAIYTKQEPRHRIALLLDKGIDMVLAILAVWKAGASYIPLDPSYPCQRVSHILEETSPTVLLTSVSHKLDAQTVNGVPVVSLDSIQSRQILASLPTIKPTLAGEKVSADLAYIIFTSGTTGKPKGVLVQHSSVVHFRNALLGSYWNQNPQKQQSVLFLSNYVFDFSIEQLSLSILSGNKLIIPPEEGVTHEVFYKLANQEQLSYLSGTPSVLQQIQLSRLEHLKMVTLAGEEFHRNQFDRIRSQFQGQINNAYGITETTVYNIVTKFAPDAPFTKALCNELPGTQVYVLNSHLQHVPTNAVGELYIGGDCLARGYLNQDSLTEERFVPNPFFESNVQGPFSERLYKTGDLVCYRGPCQLEYLGRRDQQVKLRGFRIELSEVTNAVSLIDGVKDAVVIPQYPRLKDGSESRAVGGLACYYTADGEGARAVTPATIWAELSKQIPGYMIPSQVYRIKDSLPVTINGKVDLSRLSEHNHVSSQNQQSVPPRNALERTLCELWPSLYGKACVSIDDDFFACGGDSISSLRLVGEVYHATGCHITVKDIYQHKTIRSLYENVLFHNRASNSNPIVPVAARKRQIAGDQAPLSPIQRWFLAKPLQNPHHWNHCFSIRTPSLDKDRLESALKLLHERHDALRTRLVLQVDGYVQGFAPDCPAPGLNRVDQSRFGDDHDAIRFFNELQSRFDLQRGPLYTVVYDCSQEGSGSGRIWFAFHHIIIDTVSWSIILSELQALYQGAKLGRISTKFQEWAFALDEYEMTLEETGHWNMLRGKLGESFEALPLSVGSVLRCEEKLSREDTAVLIRSCSVLSAGMHEVLLMAVGTALQSILRDGPSLVTIEGHGREERVDPNLDVSRTVGWFTSMYPFEIPRVNSRARGVIDTRHAIKRVPHNGVGYGSAYGYGDRSLPAVSVNYLGRMGDRQAHADNNWSLHVDDKPIFPSGLCTSSCDEGKSSSMVDFTFSIADGRLVTLFSCCWGHSTAHHLMSTVQRSLQELTEETGMECFQPPSPSRGLDFTPYFVFEGESRTGPPLFLLPPGEGGAESYFGNIVRGLPDRNLVVFNNHYRERKDIETIQGLSEYYLTHIKAIQPAGPYDIVGWSFGGIISLEVTRRITSSGGNIGTLALIDPFFDIPSAAEAIGHEGPILDPIYSNYRPEPEGFQCVSAHTERVVLFKATEASEEKEETSAAERELFSWFQRLPTNNLDTFISPGRIETVPIRATHFSWVHRADEVERICSTLRR